MRFQPRCQFDYASALDPADGIDLPNTERNESIIVWLHDGVSVAVRVTAVADSRLTAESEWHIDCGLLV